MKKSFITLGLLIALTPQFGFPQLWKDIFVTVAGLLIVLLVYIPSKDGHISPKVKKDNSFIENAPNV